MSRTQLDTGQSFLEASTYILINNCFLENNTAHFFLIFTHSLNHFICDPDAHYFAHLILFFSVNTKLILKANCGDLRHTDCLNCNGMRVQRETLQKKPDSLIFDITHFTSSLCPHFLIFTL